LFGEEVTHSRKNKILQCGLFTVIGFSCFTLIYIYPSAIAAQVFFLKVENPARLEAIWLLGAWGEGHVVLDSRLKNRLTPKNTFTTKKVCLNHFSKRHML